MPACLSKPEEYKINKKRASAQECISFHLNLAQRKRQKSNKQSSKCTERKHSPSHANFYFALRRSNNKPTKLLPKHP